MEHAETAKARYKYLTFRIGGDEYGLEIGKVREIVELMRITTVPRTPEFIKGVINLRGSVIPIVELRSKFGMPSVPDTQETCVIVVEIVKEGLPASMGIIVDAVSEVMDISTGDIDKAPSFGVDLDTSYILGVAKTPGGVKILLDIENVLTKNGVMTDGNEKSLTQPTGGNI